MSAPEKVEITLPELYDDWPQLVRVLRRGRADSLADQIEAQLPTPEPTNLAAVIRDGIGRQWVATRVSPTTKRLVWMSEEGASRQWPAIPQPITLLHEGWKPEDEQ